MINSPLSHRSVNNPTFFPAFPLNNPHLLQRITPARQGAGGCWQRARRLPPRRFPSQWTAKTKRLVSFLSLDVKAQPVCVTKLVCQLLWYLQGKVWPSPVFSPVFPKCFGLHSGSLGAAGAVAGWCSPSLPRVWGAWGAGAKLRAGFKGRRES